MIRVDLARFWFRAHRALRKVRLGRCGPIMVGGERVSAVEDGACAGLGAEVEAAQQLCVKGDDNR